LSASNQISFYIKKTHDSNETIFSENLFGPYNAAGGFTGQYISNLVDQSSSTNTITYQLGYKINGNVSIDDVVGILGYDSSYNNSIFLQEFEGSGTTAVSVWNKGSDSNGLYYNDGTVHIGSNKNALDSINTQGVALELSGNLVGTNATFSNEINTNILRANEGYFSSNTLYINGKPVLNEDTDGNRTVNTDLISCDGSNGLIIKTVGDNTNIILDPSGTGKIKFIGDIESTEGNITAEKFIGDVTGNVVGDVTGNVVGDVIGTVTGSVSSLLNHTTNNLTEGSNNKYYTSTRVRSELSSGLGITYNQNIGEFSLPQEVSTSSNVNFNSVTASSSLETYNAQVNNDLTVSGNIRVNGTQTIVNSTVVEIGDNKIVLNAGGLSSNNAGIIANVNNSEYEFIFKSTESLWYANNSIQSGTGFIGDIVGDVTGNVVGDVTGNVVGDVSGTVTGINVSDLQTSLNTVTTIAQSTSLLTSQHATTISELITSVASKQDTITSNSNLNIQDLTLSGCLRGPGTMYIDPANDGASGTLIVNGNLTVKGTTTTIDAENMKISDNDITLNKNYSGSSPNENASIQIERGSLDNSIIKWNEQDDQWEFYKEGTYLSKIKCDTIKVSEDSTLGNVSASVSGTTLIVNGNANTSYGVCSVSGNITNINTLNISNISKNTQILIYYTNTSGSDLTITNTISGIKTNISQDLTIINGDSVLFCIVNINGNYILTVSQLY
jgi:uncharacterized protein YcfJ